MGRSRRIALALGLAALAGLSSAAVYGCGASAEGEGGRHPDYATALSGSPPPLAALYRQGNELLPGGTDAFEKRIAGLRGYPVVVNVWASWCGPCRYEFPTLQKLAARYGRRVAFLGVDSEDDEAAARTFLREDPVPYPSYIDGDKAIGDEIGITGFPDTAFYDSHGKLTYLKQGPYTQQGELRADVRRCALEERCEGG